MAYGLGTMSARPRRRNQRPAALMRNAAAGGIAPGDQPTRPHEGMVQFGQNNERWGVPQALQRRNAGQPTVQWDTGWGTPPQGGGGMPNHVPPGTTPPIIPKPPLGPLPGGGAPAAPVGDGLPRGQLWGEHGNITQAAADAAGSYAAAGRAQGVANFNLDEWAQLPPDVLARNLQTLWNTPGASRFMTEDQMLQLQALGQQRGVALPYALGSGGGTGGPSAPTTMPHGAGSQGTYGGGLAGGAQNVTPEQMTQGNAPTTTTPQQGAQNQQAANAQIVAHTPQAAMAAGRNPEKHQAYWQSVGWTLNPATGEWTQAGGGGQGGTPPGQPGPGGQPNHVPPGTTPPINPNQPGGVSTQQQPGQFGMPAQGQQGLPLDATFEGQRRLLEDALQASLSPLNAQGESIGAQLQLALAREQTNKMYDQQNLREGLNSRGMLDSSIYGDDLGKLATDYLRQSQDLGAQASQAYGNLAAAASGAYGDYYRGMAEYLLQLQNRQESSPYTVTPSIPNQSRIAPRRRRRRRNGR